MSNRRLLNQRWQWICLSLLTLIFTWGINAAIAYSQSDSRIEPLRSTPVAQTQSIAIDKPHPLPPQLAQWNDPSNAGDYFDQIQPVSIGYLIWSRFPVTVYVEPLKSGEQPDSFGGARSQTWINAVTTAIREWNQYLPLQQVSQPGTADIQVWRSAPPLQFERDRPNAPPRLGRVRAAETRFQLYSTPPAKILSHRFTILLRPDQAPQYTLATARHELGHAIGIWGHSQQPSDVLYFSQVGQPPLISARDINTLKRIYQQPTQLGWSLP